MPLFALMNKPIYGYTEQTDYGDLKLSEHYMQKYFKNVCGVAMKTKLIQDG